MHTKYFFHGGIDLFSVCGINSTVTMWLIRHTILIGNIEVNIKKHNINITSSPFST